MDVKTTESSQRVDNTPFDGMEKRGAQLLPSWSRVVYKEERGSLRGKRKGKAWSRSTVRVWILREFQGVIVAEIKKWAVRSLSQRPLLQSPTYVECSDDRDHKFISGDPFELPLTRDRAAMLPVQHSCHSRKGRARNGSPLINLLVSVIAASRKSVTAKGVVCERESATAHFLISRQLTPGKSLRISNPSL